MHNNKLRKRFFSEVIEPNTIFEEEERPKILNAPKVNPLKLLIDVEEISLDEGFQEEKNKNSELYKTKNEFLLENKNRDAMLNINRKNSMSTDIHSDIFDLNKLNNFNVDIHNMHSFNFVKKRTQSCCLKNKLTILDFCKENNKN